jgi:hypothetical protein
LQSIKVNQWGIHALNRGVGKIAGPSIQNCCNQRRISLKGEGNDRA